MLFEESKAIGRITKIVALLTTFLIVWSILYVILISVSSVTYYWEQNRNSALSLCPYKYGF
jgi:hypothetical protein